MRRPIRRRTKQSVPPVILAITGLWISLLLGASLLWPMTYGYDEMQHVDMAYRYSVQPFHFYAPGTLYSSSAIAKLQVELPTNLITKPLSGVAIPPRGERPSLAALGARTIDPRAGQDQMIQHPPLYYWLEAIVLRLPGVSHLAWDLQIWLMRLLSVLMMVPVPYLCWATTRELIRSDESTMDESDRPVERRKAMIATFAAAIPLTLPNLIRDGSSVTNDALLISATSVMIYALSKVLRGDLSIRTAAWVSSSLIVALLAKGFALVFPPFILVAYFIGYRIARNRESSTVTSRSTVRPLLVLLAGAVVGGLWWLRNLVDYGAIQTNGFGPNSEVRLFGPPDNKGRFWAFLPNFLTQFADRIWGGFGLPGLPAESNLFIYGWLALALIGCCTAVATRVDQRRSPLLLATIVVVSILTFLQSSFSNYRHWSNILHGVQGRYIYHLIAIIAALSAIGWMKLLAPPAQRGLTTAVVVGALVTNVQAWYMILSNWYAPLQTGFIGSLKAGVHSLFRWAPTPVVVTIALVVVFPIVAALLTLVTAVRQFRQLGTEQNRPSTPAEEYSGGATPSAPTPTVT